LGHPGRLADAHLLRYTVGCAATVAGYGRWVRERWLIARGGLWRDLSLVIFGGLASAAARQFRQVETCRWNVRKSAFADCGRGIRPRRRPSWRRWFMPSNRAEIYLHLVWATWDRVPLLTGEVREMVYRSLQAECLAMRVEVIAIGGMEDHVHILVRAPASIAPAELAKQVKGASSFLVNSAARPVQVFRWQGGYGVFSVSRQHVARIRGYVLNQEAHHREGRLASYLEPIVPGDPGEQTNASARHGAKP
ncbi:MAG TPA: IS200/IS605 family transposase, partial [Longimicrobiaceae bacterium]